MSRIHGNILGMEEVRLSRIGKLTIPTKIRKKLGLKSGDVVKVFEYGETIYVIPKVKNPVKKAAGSLARRPSLAKQLLKDRAKE